MGGKKKQKYQQKQEPVIETAVIQKMQEAGIPYNEEETKVEEPASATTVEAE